jgi:iron complex outermembrane receptor protein
LTGVSALALLAAGLPQFVAAAVVDTDADTIIVTGTRDVGVKALDSSSEIQVIGSESLEATGATSALDALREVLPSFAVTAFNGDAGALIRAARLRGMNPNEVLVLVNGKRRHQSAAIIPGGSDQSPDAGSNETDLDMIPLSLIDHVEVLLDGAAAQYGSDAVAGVINIILKNAHSGTNITAGGGVTSRGDGAQGAVGFSQAASILGDGFVDVSVDYRHHDFSNRNGINCRTYNPSCGSSTAGEVNIYGVVNGPIRNRIDGSPLSDIVNFGLNAEKPINNDITAYAFGTFGRRSSQGFENNREDARAPFYWPDGFFPRMTLNEVDGAITGGIKGEHLFSKWDWDLSVTYGRDSDHFGLMNSYNTGLSNPPTYAPHPGLGLDTGFTGGPLYSEDNEQTTVNADFRRPIDTGFLAGPLNVAAGAEFRYEYFALGAGAPDTYLDGGTQSEAGATPTDASTHTRTVEAVYGDLSAKVIPKLTMDLAARFEDYSQTGVGSTVNEKATARYDVTPQIGIRGTVSNGFHAPTLAQSYFSETGVTPTSLSIQAPPSSPGAQILGAQPLKPETSKDVSFGFVVEPLPRLHVTADVYQIFLDKQIIDSAQVGGPLALQAAAANGNPIPAALLASTKAFVSAFTNSIDTRTRGLDVTADYKSDFGKYGTVKWALAGNINNIAITNQYPIPPAFAAALIAAGQTPSFVTPQIRTDVTKSSPANKLTLSANWHIGKADVTVRETRYGHADETNGSSTAVTPFSNIYIKSAYITDVDLGYFITDNIKVNIGGNNVFDVLPGHVPLVLQQSSRQSSLYPYYTPWGIDGAYFYSRIVASF